MCKNVVFATLLLILTFGLVGCGTTEPITISTSDTSADSSIENTATEDSITKNESSEETNTSDSNESNTATTARPTSQNIEDYWQGSDYFDLEGYVLARGGTDYTVKECSSSGYYYGGHEASFNYRGWEIEIPFIYSDNSFCKGTDIVFQNSSTYVLAGFTTAMTTPITVDSNGNTISNSTEDVLMMILNDIDSYTGSNRCPACEAGHETGTQYSKGVSYNHSCLANH